MSKRVWRLVAASLLLIIVSVGVYVGTREAPAVVVMPANTLPLPPKDGLTAHERILRNYTGQARALKARALETNDPKDQLAFIEYIKSNPSEGPARGTAAPASPTGPEVPPR